MRVRAFFSWRWWRSGLSVLLPFSGATASSRPAGWRRRTGRASGGPPPVQLPEGAGREHVQATCTRCHGLNMIANSWGYTKDGWQDRIATMVKLPAAELESISSYLAAHYPIKDVPGAVLISGPATVSIKEWLAPTLGSRPHDSHAAADGSIWWTGHFASKLGRLDPRSGQIREFELPANTQPHGLGEDPAGEYLAHRDSEGRDRSARSPHGSSEGVSAQRPRRTRSAHTDHRRTQRQPLLHAAVRTCRPHQHGDRRHGDQEDAERQYLSVRHPPQLERRALVHGLSRPPHRQRRSENHGDQASIRCRTRMRARAG